MASVIVLGSINIDLVVYGPRLPAPGETVLGGRFAQVSGGKGANQAVAAARAGKDPVLFIAAVGSDSFGRAALESLGRERLDLSHVKTIDGEATGVALIMVDGQGENCISVALGANAALTAADFENIPAGDFEAAKVFLACLESPLDAVRAGLVRAKKTGLTTILNPAPADAAVLQGDLLTLVDILTPNRAEAAALSGVAITDPESAIRAARKLQGLGCGTVIVTLGQDGCVVVERDPYVTPALAVEAVDATAAGDAFSGVLAVALAEGHPVAEAACWATAAAGISVTRRGAQPSLPGREEILSNARQTQ